MIKWFLLIFIALLLLYFSGYLSIYLTIFFAVVFNIWVLRKQWLKHAVRLPAQRLKRYVALFLTILGGVASWKPSLFIAFTILDLLADAIEVWHLGLFKILILCPPFFLVITVLLFLGEALGFYLVLLYEKITRL